MKGRRSGHGMQKFPVAAKVIDELREAVGRAW